MKDMYPEKAAELKSLWLVSPKALSLQSLELSPPALFSGARPKLAVLNPG